MIRNLTDKFCKLAAPGQEEQMKAILESEEKKQSESDVVLTHLKEAFDMCSTRTARRSILMLIPKGYSKAKVSELFECSLYEVKRARTVLKTYGPCEAEPQKETVYSRLSVQKARHFIDFLLSTGLLQEVAFGTTKLKFDSGDKVTVSNTILNGIYEHAVKEYLIYCKEIDYKQLGRSTLLKILGKMKPHIRKKLAGVDSFVVEGIEAFESLRSCLKLLRNNEDAKQLLNSINQAEDYLKARYKMHCSYNDSCESHCINHALSHPKDMQLFSKCEAKHERTCSECKNVVNCIASVKVKLNQMPTSHEKEVAVWDVSNAELKILEWQKHILRGVQQSKARENVFKELGPMIALWIRDFAQKYIPTKTLEAMNEYFGKRGMSVSVEVFITKIFMKYHKSVYLVALDRCDQDTLETLCIADVVIQKFKKDNPHIERIELKSDNAGNYHANGVPECMYKICKEICLNLSAYNYNEAQLGKDQCDREAAFFKQCAERFLRKKETHKISSAKELVEAVMSEGGPKNTQMCVLKIDKSIAKLERIEKITNISYYHSVVFQDTGALYREYFDIGPGKFYPYNTDTQFVNGASFVVDWKSSNRQDESMIYDSRNNNLNFPCPETLCISEFKNENDLISHVESGNHQYAKIKTGIDKALCYYAEQKDVQNVCNETTSTNQRERDEPCSDRTNMYCQGWARKVRRVSRLTEKQKIFIEQLFRHGAETNTKLSAEQMCDRMKNEIVAGVYYFSPNEYLEPKKIRNLISRLNKKDCTTQAQPQLFEMLEDDGIEQNMDYICDFVLHSDDEDFLGFEGV